MIAPGSGIGKFVFDDTMVVSPKHTEKDTSAAVEMKKISAIIGAEYEGGFTKLYLGSSDDTANKISNLPRALAALTSAYERVTLSNGGGLHTPEYFVEFYGRKSLVSPNTDTWLPPTIIARDGTRFYAPSDLEEKDYAKVSAAKLNYLHTWLSLKIYDVIRGNFFLSAQVRSGVLRFDSPESWVGTHFAHFTSLSLGGSDTFNSQGIVSFELEGGASLDLGAGLGIIPSVLELPLPVGAFGSNALPSPPPTSFEGVLAPPPTVNDV